MTPDTTMDTAAALEAIQDDLAGKAGPEYWRSLEEYSHTDAFQATIDNEFPVLASTPPNSLSRRNFLQVMGATLALAGVTGGCGRQPLEKIYPYVQQPEEVVPGKPLFFASAGTFGGYAFGVLVESHLGRPTKVDGLPEHPSSLGGTSTQVQASILDLYDPDRSKITRKSGALSSWGQFISAARGMIASQSTRGGEGIRILTETVTSPSLGGMIRSFLAANPNAQWHQYESAGRDSVREGARLAFGEYVDTVYHFDRADVVVSLDSDFLATGPGQVRYSKDFAQRRDAIDAQGEGSEHDSASLNRTYAFESSPTLVGAGADHHFPVKPSEIEAIARSIADALGVRALAGGDAGLSADRAAQVEAIVKDLKAHRSHGIVIAGEHQPAAVHAVVHAINDVLGNNGSTVDIVPSAEVEPVNQLESLKSLTADMAAGKVEFLLMIGGNPVYAAPADLNFAEALAAVPMQAHLSRYVDETSRLCRWHMPESHYLEAWGDGRGHDGTASIGQPLIAPLYSSKTATELFSALTDEVERSAHEIVQAQWSEASGAPDFDRWWRKVLSEGFVEGSAAAPVRKSVRVNNLPTYEPAEALGDGEIEVVFLPDPSVGNGTFSNNAWLQEVPNPLTKITWDAAVLVGYSTASKLGLANEDLVEVTIGDRSVQGPVWIQPAHGPDTVTLHLGYGRTAVGKVANDIGFDFNAVRSSDAVSIGARATIRKTGSKYPLARTEEHFNMEGRALVRHFTQREYEEGVAQNEHFVSQGAEHEHHVPAYTETMLDPDEKAWDKNAWGMTIDLNKCTGCNACIIACQSENIIPVVGKLEVRKGREMQWIRIDRYYHTGSLFKGNTRDLKDTEQLDNAKTYFQPVPCMQCENAPCEIVCPVAATQHTKEGLNDMVYNRCIGTRYCSNNCPYKVRRFNFYQYSRTPLGSRGDRVYTPLIEYTHVHPETLRSMRNPDVTVRGRGVMEKCTYCVQRINLARIDAKKEDRAIADGEVVVACQQACPSDAIAFGNINDAESKVAELKHGHRNYGILEDLNTKPRTTYLARITNPNPEIKA